MRLLQTGEADAEKSIQKNPPIETLENYCLRPPRNYKKLWQKKKKNAKYEGMSLHLYLVTHSI